MARCKHCVQNFPTVLDPDGGYICCTGCGRVVDEDIYSTEVTFIKGAGGQSQLASSYVRSVQSDFSASHERTLNKGRDEIREMVVNLCIGGGDSIINQAHAFYTIAVEKNFTRGRRTVQVAAACLYIACRQNSKAYLLIDFSDYLRINVYVLGAVFLLLCQRLRLEEHPIVQKPIDPSLFIHRFTERLLGEKNFAVSRTAMRIIASMKRDWMQTGRKPSGLCGAALYISALSHGLKYSKSDIVSVVHICEATLTKRLIEFENTDSGSLTIEEFNTKASELEREPHSRQPKFHSTTSGILEVLCEHKASGEPHFAHGLCKQCYDDFIELSGGLQGGSEPPAFQRAERQRMSRPSPEERAEPPSLNTPAASRENGHIHNEKEVGSSATAKLSKEKSCSTAKPDEIENEPVASKEPENLGTTTGHPSVDEASNLSHEHQDTDGIAGDESESLSDIDDAEVSGYLHNEEEARYKKIIWEEMNKEYLEEQAAKESAAAAAKEAYEANMKNCSEDMLAYQELAAAAAAAVAKSRKERKQKRADEARNSTPAQTAAEAARQMLSKKRLSSKINYDVLEKLFDDSTPENEKKQRTKSDLGIDADREEATDHALGSEAVDTSEYDANNGFGEEGGTDDAYGDYPYYGNQDETYGYDEGYDSDY